MRRLYYLTKDIERAQVVSREMHQHGVSDWNFHIVSKDEVGLYTHHLHGLNFLGKSDFLHSGEQGALVGFGIGAAIAIGLSIFTQASVPLIILCMIALTMFGTWVGGLAGFTLVNYKLARFDDLLTQGHHLVMIDVPKGGQLTLESMMAEKFADVPKVGEDSTVVNPFARGKSIPLPRG